MRILMRSFALAAAAFLSACAPHQDPAPATRDVPLVTKVTRETYLSGDQFCEKYKQYTAAELGVKVEVPKDYDHPELGTLTLRAYTLKEFDSKKPSYIFIDGGPGQNTHGMMPDYFGEQMNEIRYDQRGLGCSAPATFDDYSQVSLYSSVNNAKDLDLIRKAYGIDKWSVYGVSYGTVPATIYASKFSEHTLSNVIEGVVGDVSLLGDPDFKAKKLNLFLNLLTTAQHTSFTTVVLEDSPDTVVIVSGLMNSFYQDKGLATFAQRLAYYIHTDGTIDRAALADYRQRMAARAAKFPSPQQPGAVDENILTIIYCRDLGARNGSRRGLAYNGTFIVKSYASDAGAKGCDDAGVPSTEQQTYRPGDYKTMTPTYYFQGALDGATVAMSAYEHWQDAPQGKSYFMLAKRGGHNPNLTRLESSTPAIATMENALFLKAMNGEDITTDDITQANTQQPADEPWVLYLSKDVSIDDNLQGLHVVR